LFFSLAKITLPTINIRFINYLNFWGYWPDFAFFAAGRYVKAIDFRNKSYNSCSYNNFN